MKRYTIVKFIITGLTAIVIGFSTTRILTGNKFPKLDDKNLMLMLFNYFIAAAILSAVFDFSGVSAKFCEYSRQT